MSVTTQILHQIRLVPIPYSGQKSFPQWVFKQRLISEYKFKVVCLIQQVTIFHNTYINNSVFNNLLRIRLYEPTTGLALTCRQTEVNHHPATFRDEIWSVRLVPKLFLVFEAGISDTNQWLSIFYDAGLAPRLYPGRKFLPQRGSNQCLHPYYESRAVSLEPRDDGPGLTETSLISRVRFSAIPQF